MGELLPMSTLLQTAVRGGFAVPAFCVWNAETTEAALRVASRLEAPVILMNGPGEFPLLRPKVLADITRALVKTCTVPAALHLDHGDSLQLVDECLAAGYTSVMLDFSRRSWDENVSALRETVARARPLGVTVEGEIGHVGSNDSASTESQGASTLTEPAEAAAYVAAAGVDALAVSVGNAHGQYTRLPSLDFDRLEAIRDAVRIPLVLHGGSGTPPDDLRRAISLGIAKVNVATELVAAVRSSLMDQWQAKTNLWTPAALAVAAQAIEPVVERWLRATGAAGRA